MNHTLKNFALLLALLFFSSCSSLTQTTQSDKKTCPLESKNMAPTWVCSPQLAGGIASVGVEQANIKDEDLQMPMAFETARKALEGQMFLKVKKIFKNFMQLSGLGSDRVMKKLAVEISKKLNQSLIHTAEKRKKWIDETTKDLYLLISIEPQTSVATTKKYFLDALAKEKTLWKKILSENGLKVLDMEIKKEIGQLPRL